jgi:hypothetical protein
LLGFSLVTGTTYSADTAYFDTAWTYVYDGGIQKNGRAIGDNFHDLKILPNGDAISLGNRLILSRPATINAMVETKDGRILAVAGDDFPNNGSLPLNNYAALLRYDSLGAVVLVNDWLNTTGYELAGWSLTPSLTGGYMLGGKQSVFTFDDFGVLGGQSNYSFSLPGVGSVLNNVSRVHQLRNGTVMVAGKTYEEACWKRYQRLRGPLCPQTHAPFHCHSFLS